MTAIRNVAKERLGGSELANGLWLKARTVDIAKIMKTCGFDSMGDVYQPALIERCVAIGFRRVLTGSDLPLLKAAASARGGGARRAARLRIEAPARRK